jgi:hypothetical protein
MDVDEDAFIIEAKHKIQPSAFVDKSPWQNGEFMGQGDIPEISSG